MADPARLPSSLSAIFWDCDFASLRWPGDRDFVVGRVLAQGDWDSLCWLRAELGDGALREWILARRGRGLAPRELRFWEVVLELPHAEVSRWIEGRGAEPWENRVTP